MWFFQYSGIVWSFLKFSKTRTISSLLFLKIAQNLSTVSYKSVSYRKILSVCNLSVGITLTIHISLVTNKVLKNSSWIHACAFMLISSNSGRIFSVKSTQYDVTMHEFDQIYFVKEISFTNLAIYFNLWANEYFVMN